MDKGRSHNDVLVTWRRRLDRCWTMECDVDPLILRRRLLNRQGRLHQARGIEQEMQPVI